VTGPLVGAVVSGLVTPVGFAPATDLAFGIVFGVFVLALAVLAVVAIRWGVRRDRPGRQAWRDRRLGVAPPESANGHVDTRTRPASGLDDQ
jgi:hypothetical protein